MEHDHNQQAIRDLIILRQQLFNQRTERKKYYRKTPNNKNDMEQENNRILSKFKNPSGLVLM